MSTTALAADPHLRASAAPGVQVAGWRGRLNAAGSIALVGLAFAVPVSTALANVLLPVLVLCWLAGGQYRAKLRWFVDSPVALAALLLFAWLVLSLVWTDSIGRDQRVFLRKYADLPLVAVFLWFALDPRHRARALGGFAAAMLLTLVLSYAAAAGWLPSARWLRATPGNAVVFKLHITHGLLMALAALLFGHYAVTSKQAALRIAWAAASLLAVINVVFMVQGRTGYVVLAAFVVLVFALRLGWRGIVIAAVLVATGAAALYETAPALRQRVDLALAEYTQWDAARPAALDNSIGRRLEFFSTALGIIAERPWLGHGVGSFPAAYRARVEGTGREPTSNPHNEFLLLAVQGGLPAVALFLYLLARTWTTAGQLPTARERLLARALACWIIVGCTFNALLIDHTEGLLFALLLGVLFAGASRSAAAAHAAEATPHSPAAAGQMPLESPVAPGPPAVPTSASTSASTSTAATGWSAMRPPPATAGAALPMPVRSATGGPSLSVVIIARNEAQRIARCLDSVRWADEVIVLDGGSTDATVAIAREQGARVEVAADWQGFGRQKNRALALAGGDWILSIDADEWVDEAMAQAVRAVVSSPASAAVWRMPRRSRYCGQVMRHSGWWPDHVIRLWRRGAARFSEDLVHERVLVDPPLTDQGDAVDGSPATLQAALDHDSFTGFEQVIDKMNRYSTDGAQMMHARGLQGSVTRALGHGLWTFLRTYVLRRGFLDGRYGLLLAISNAEGSYYRYLKLMQHGRR